MTAESATLEGHGEELRRIAMSHPILGDDTVPHPDLFRVYVVGNLQFRVALALVADQQEGHEPWWSVGIAVAQGYTSIPATDWTAEKVKLADGIAMRLLGPAGLRGIDHESREIEGMMMVYYRRASPADLQVLQSMIEALFESEAVLH